jgi:hypothetical protein
MKTSMYACLANLCTQQSHSKQHGQSQNTRTLTENMLASFVSFIEDHRRRHAPCIGIMSTCLLVRPSPRLTRCWWSGYQSHLRYVSHEIHVQYRLRLTSIKDGHGGAAEELTASGTKLDLYRQYVSGSPPKS